MRLTDVDALWERLNDEPWENNADRDEIALPIVNAAPIIDAVPVVYCKDCKYLAKFGHCEHPREHELLPATYSYDFCIYGERRDKINECR